MLTVAPKRNHFKPSRQFMAGTKDEGTPAQARHMDETAHQWTRAQVLLSRGQVEAAHKILDQIASGLRESPNYRDLHLCDLSMSHHIKLAMEEANLSTVADIAYGNPALLAQRCDLMDVLKASLAALRRVIELQQELR